MRSEHIGRKENAAGRRGGPGGVWEREREGKEKGEGGEKRQNCSLFVDKSLDCLEWGDMLLLVGLEPTSSQSKSQGLVRSFLDFWAVRVRTHTIHGRFVGAPVTRMRID